MGQFIDAALSFPAVILSFLLAAVVLYWLLVLIGTLDVGLGDLDLADGMGLGGVPVTVTTSILIVVDWFLTIAGTVAIDGLSPVPHTILGIAVLLAGTAVGLVAARFAAQPLRRLYRTEGEASRVDFVGRECVIRTGRVTGTFGQAEVTAADGSSAIVQVRQTGEHELTTGYRALIFDYDIDGEYFWVAPA